MTTEKQNRKVIVCQRGARHRYAIPRMFEEEGMLAALYTDSTVYSPLGRLAGLSGGGGASRLGALTARKPEGVPENKVRSSDRLVYAAFSKGLIRPELSPVFRHWGLGDADVVYSMYGEDRPFLEWAKKRGAKIVVDVFISPLANRNLFEEQQQFHVPGRTKLSESECRPSTERGIGAYAPIADILLCPSEWVAEGVKAFVPDQAHKIRVVPYGSSIRPGDQQGVERGRLLFAGRDALRKGLPYLAQAVEKLSASGLTLEARVAGLSAEECAWMPGFQSLEFLGVVEMARMSEEYARADLFVLPSLAEGQAGVVLEALAHGCPVVATRESGVDFKNGEDGLLVEMRSVEQLEAAIRRIVTDRAERNRIGANGKKFFEREFSSSVWKERLVEVINTL